jgi:molybdopterin-guanine dinucleotide biosynthesis protein A
VDDDYRKDAPLPEQPAASSAQAARGDVAGCVLAGGKSTRLGLDKARIRLPEADGPHLLARTHELVSRILPRCWVVCRPGHPFPGYDCIFDAVPGLGPLSGVHAALLEARRTGCHALLAVPCDMPFLDAQTLLRLLEARTSRPEGTCLTTYRQRRTGFIEALTAIYEVEAIPLFNDALAQGERMLNRIVPPRLQCHIPYGEEDARPFFNINFPADLAEAHRMAMEG